MKRLILVLIASLPLFVHSEDVYQHPYEGNYLFTDTYGFINHKLEFEIDQSKDKKNGWKIEKDNDLQKYEKKTTGMTINYNVQLKNNKVQSLSNSVKTASGHIVSHLNIDSRGKIESSTRCDASTRTNNEFKCTTINYDLCSFVDSELYFQFEKIQSCNKACEGLEEIKIPSYLTVTAQLQEKNNLAHLSEYISSKKTYSSLDGIKNTVKISKYMSSLTSIVQDCATFNTAIKWAEKTDTYSKQSQKIPVKANSTTTKN